MSGWKENVRKVTPYVAGEQPKCKNVVKLNTNENPYPPSPKVFEANKNIEVGEFSLYPNTVGEPLLGELVKYHGLKPGQVILGVGSDDILALAFLTFFNSDKPVFFPDITYSFYPVWAKLYDIPYKCPNVNDDYTININDYISDEKKGGIVIANPNAPTTIAMTKDEIEKIVAANKDLVIIIDEAYIDFGGQTVLSLIDKYDNLLVVRTYSKSRSMAGARIGYAMGNKELISAMLSVRDSINSYPMSRQSIAVGKASLEDEEYFNKCIEKIVATRKRSKLELEKRGFDVLESSANFLFAKPTKISAKELFEKLREKNIFVRYFEKERLSDRLRITVGTDEQMDKLFEAIDLIQNK